MDLLVIFGAALAGVLLVGCFQQFKKYNLNKKAVKKERVPEMDSESGEKDAEKEKTDDNLDLEFPAESASENSSAILNEHDAEAEKTDEVLDEAVINCALTKIQNCCEEVIAINPSNDFLSIKGQLSELEFPIGFDLYGDLVKADIEKINHLLVAGSLGSGKTVFVESLLQFLIANNSDTKIKFLICDTKINQYAFYNRISNLIVPIVTDEIQIKNAVTWLSDEVSKRLRLFEQKGEKDIRTYNSKARRELADEMPHIVFILDDISLLDPLLLEDISIAMISGRAVGIHIIAVTSTVCTNKLKAFAQRFSNKVVLQNVLSEIRTLTGIKKPPVLNQPGELLFCSMQTITQAHSYMPSNLDYNFCESKKFSSYNAEVLKYVEKGKRSAYFESEDDPLLFEAIAIVVNRGEASTSLLQRRLKVGYARADGLVKTMEERDIVGPFDGIRPRKVLITPEQWQQVYERLKSSSHN